MGELNGAYNVFNTMMVPERLGTAAMTIGPVINQFQGVSFQVAEAAMLLDAARSLTYTTCRAVDENIYE